MADKQLVDLTCEERGYLLDVIHKGKTSARRVVHALIEKVCPDIGEDTIKAAIMQPNGNDL